MNGSFTLNSTSKTFGDLAIWAIREGELTGNVPSIADMLMPLASNLISWASEAATRASAVTTFTDSSRVAPSSAASRA